ncbi:AI-2E family transporter [Falsiroseomonas sp. HC035]|uniref:AI-2E family transporter n=1 Tax=Falsiroseomonas sp. HC035 TaxID=3390999 RepID=UPI003D321010
MQQDKANTASPAAGGVRGDVAFLRRVLIVAAVILLLLLLWQVREALLLTFAGVLVAVLLLAVAKPVEARIGLSRTLSLLAVGLALAALLGLAGVLVGSEVTTQVAQLWEQLPRAIGAFEHRFDVDIPPLGEAARQAGGEGGGEAGGRADGGFFDASVLRTLAGHAATAGTMIVNALSALVIAAVGGFFLAMDPAMYRKGVVMLVPVEQQGRVEDALLATGNALRMWLGAQMVSMCIVGTLAGLGTWLIGLPSPLALGLFAGLVGFVPLLGAVAGAVPPLLLALAAGGDALLWTAVLFLAIQQLESNMILPLVEKHMVSMPPALMLFAVVAVGLLFGLPGVILAAPITVVAYVLVKQLYVRETLGQQTEVPGEDDAPQ